MPQPIRSRLGANLRFQMTYGGVLNQRPQLALKVMRIIELWSYTEMFVVQLVGNFLHIDVGAANAMLYSIESSRARRAAIKGAARYSLQSEDFLLFEAVMDTTRASERRRDEFAHSVWGLSPELPDDVLLIEPRSHNTHTAFYKEASHAHKQGLTLPNTYNEAPTSYDGVWVYTVQDLDNEVAAAARANNVISKLNYVLGQKWMEGGSNAIDPMRTSLLQDPLIAQRLDILRQKTRPQSQP